MVVGDNNFALTWAAALHERGILVVAIRPPTVPPGTARLRFSLSAGHTADDIARTVEALVEIRKELVA